MSWIITIAMMLYTVAYAAGEKTPSLKTCDPNCELPDCYCDYLSIPGGYSPRDTPQMVLFTYTGPVTRTIREAIVDLFPDSLRNPNRCSIGVTLFIISQGSDDCGVYRLYYRGHEVALAGTNRTATMEVDWMATLTQEQMGISGKSNVDAIDITGMRAQNLRPGGDHQFRALQGAGLLYDSSLLAGPVDTPEGQRYLWPFTLDQSLEQHELNCRNRKCPTESYPGVWEIPVSPLLGTRMGNPRYCSYLDDCLSDVKSGSEVFKLLKQNFDHRYTTNRAPLQVNLQPRSLTTGIIRDGLKEFIAYVQRKPDAWVVTNQEALKWSQKPVPLSNLVESGIWDCPSRGKYIKCKLGKSQEVEIPRSTFRLIMNVDRIWLWQAGVIAVLYLTVYRYDRYVDT